MSISISSPASGATVSGTVNVVGTSSQTITPTPGGTVASPSTLTTQSFSVAFDTTQITNGTTSLSVSNGVASASVSVTVSNTVTASPNGTTIPSATQIVDASGAIWTVVSGVVKKNGSNAGTSSSVITLLWYNGVVWQENVDDLWWPWSGTAWTGSGVSDPRTPPTVDVFYGVCAHKGLGGAYDSVSVATQVATLVDLGMKLYRSDVIDSTTASGLATFATTATASGISVLPTVGPNGSDWGGTTEATCYATWHAMGITVATALMGKVPAYEAGNEMEDAVLVGSGDGNLPADYDNTLYSMARGVINGIIDGIRSVDTTTPIVLNPVSWLHFGFTDMLLNGSSPDGTTGHQIPVVQGIGYHWYSDMANIESATGGTGTYNVLQHCQTTYGLPIWLTEYGVRPSFGSETAIKNYLVGSLMLADWVRVAATYNIVNTCLYELYDDVNGNYGLIQSNGTTHKSRYATVKSFIAANPK